MLIKCRSVNEAAELMLLEGKDMEIEIPAYLTIAQFRSQFIRMMRQLTNKKYSVKDAKHTDANVVYIKETK